MKPISERGAKSLVLRVHPKAFCEQLVNNAGYLVWEEPVPEEGMEKPSIGFGNSASQAWIDALIKTMLSSK